MIKIYNYPYFKPFFHLVKRNIIFVYDFHFLFEPNLEQIYFEMKTFFS
jgi:hypothetical protein